MVVRNRILIGRAGRGRGRRIGVEEAAQENDRDPARKGEHGNTAGLLGQHTAIFHQNDNDRVIGFHRWGAGGSNDDVLVIANFSNTAFAEYAIALPIPGTWQVRFNSTWKGYSSDFPELACSELTAEDGLATIQLAPYMVLVVSQN